MKNISAILLLLSLTVGVCIAEETSHPIAHKNQLQKQRMFEIKKIVRTYKYAIGIGSVGVTCSGLGWWYWLNRKSVGYKNKNEQNVDIEPQVLQEPAPEKDTAAINKVPLDTHVPISTSNNEREKVKIEKIIDDNEVEIDGFSSAVVHEEVVDNMQQKEAILQLFDQQPKAKRWKINCNRRVHLGEKQPAPEIETKNEQMTQDLIGLILEKSDIALPADILHKNIEVVGGTKDNPLITVVVVQDGIPYAEVSKLRTFLYQWSHAQGSIAVRNFVTQKNKKNQLYLEDIIFSRQTINGFPKEKERSLEKSIEVVQPLLDESLVINFREYLDNLKISYNKITQDKVANNCLLISIEGTAGALAQIQDILELCKKWEGYKKFGYCKVDFFLE